MSLSVSQCLGHSHWVHAALILIPELLAVLMDLCMSTQLPLGTHSVLGS